MAVDWYFLKDDIEKGPIPSSQLKAFVSEGIILPSTPVRGVSGTNPSAWIRASEVPGLFQEQPKRNLRPLIGKENIAAEWYYSEAGQRQGPVSAFALREMASTGNIKPETLVWKEGFPEWVLARKVKGLFPVDVPPPPPIQEGHASHEDTFHIQERGKEPSRTHDSKFCHECGEAINIKAVVCPKCGVAQHSDPENGLRPNDPRRGCQTTLLISAISNIIFGAIWAATCVGVILAIPMFILCFFEFRLWSDIEELPVDEVGARSGSLAIAEIVLGLFNTPTLICGIINLVRSKKMIRRHY